MKYDLEKLHQDGKINDYFFKKIKGSAFDYIDEDDIGEYLADIIQMSALGVSSPEEELSMRRIQHDVPDVLNDIVGPDFESTPAVMDALYRELYNNKDKYDLSDILQVFCSIAKAAEAVGIPLNDDATGSCNLNKMAYPQGYAGEQQKPSYDISRWMQATKDIYSRVQRGKPYLEAMNEVTSKWDKMEKLDYKHWLKFYDEGADKKYPKLATAEYHGDNGYFLPAAELPVPPREDKEQKVDRAQVRDGIEAHRSKILGRLSAAERLLCSLDGQSFAGDDQEFMLKLLQDLKRKVQTANKISIKSALFEDYIFRAGNYIKDVRGSKKGKAFFYKIAQDFGDPFAGATPPMGGDMGSAPGGNLSQDEALAMFFARIEDGLYDRDDRKEFDEYEKSKTPMTQAPSAPPVAQAFADYDIVVTAQMGMPDEDISIGTAEAAPPEDKPSQQREKLAPDVAPPMPVPQDGDITVTEEEAVGPEDKTGDIIDDALEHVTIDDAINLLEMLVGVYKQREIPRQLSKLDMVMDQLGLVAFFPQLGEAQSKALETTQYVSTRLEDILGKLKGSIQSSEADSWVEKEREVDPQTLAVQNELQESQEKEKQRKEMRKQKSDEKLDKGPAAGGVGEQNQQELSQPTPVEPGKAVQVR